jgi:hypothetical protein
MAMPRRAVALLVLALLALTSTVGVLAHEHGIEAARYRVECVVDHDGSVPDLSQVAISRTSKHVHDCVGCRLSGQRGPLCEAGPGVVGPSAGHRTPGPDDSGQRGFDVALERESRGPPSS